MITTDTLHNQDADHRHTALNPTKSFIVQAPAGSGKTELLIQRFLTLLIQVSKPEEILAITFTKKAANEMRHRVLKSLHIAATEPEPEAQHAKQTWKLARQVLEKDKQFNWCLINNPNQLRIQTIDSLCAYLTKQLPILSQFGSQPDIATDASGLYEEAVDEVLTHLETDYEWSKDVATLLTHLDNDMSKLHQLLVELLAKRDQWLAFIHFSMPDDVMKATLENHLKTVIDECLDGFDNLLSTDVKNELLIISKYAAENLRIKQIESDISQIEPLTTLPSANHQSLSLYQAIAKLLLTNDYTYRKQLTEKIGFPAVSQFKNKEEAAYHKTMRERVTHLFKKLDETAAIRQGFETILKLPAPCYSLEQWTILRSLLTVLKIVAAQLRVTFQLHGTIDFIENTQAALFALGNDDQPTDLALALDYQIKHILIDEFQDTSYTQYQLLSKLITGWQANDGRTLFVVGDPMQSIYRFREADVGLFIRMRIQGIANIPLIPLTLSVNFRSTKTIVDWNNQQFQAIFPNENDMATGAVTFSNSVAHDKAAETSNLSKIHIQGFIDGNETDEANHIIQTIQSTLIEHPNDTIAILVRSRPHLNEIIPALKAANIHYSAVSIDPLESRVHIQDLLSLTRALLHPADRIAWLAILRSPFCGLSLDDLHTIANSNKTNLIIANLSNPLLQQKLSDHGKSVIARIYPIFKSQLNHRGRKNARQTIEETWLQLGGPACLSDISHFDDINAFFNLIHQIESANNHVSVTTLENQIDKLFAVSNDISAKVQIMTIHSSKGLEFDTVILPKLDKKNQPDQKRLLLWMERPLKNNSAALLLAPIHATGEENDSIYEFIQRQHKIKADYETDRLLYVATTRAKKRLFLSYQSTSKELNKIKIEKGSFLDKLWPMLEKLNTHIPINQPTQEIFSQPIVKKRRLERLPLSWSSPLTLSNAIEVPYHHSPSGFNLNRSQAKKIGTCIHHLMERLSIEGIDWWTNLNPSQLNHLVERQLKQDGVPVSDVNNATQRVIQAIQRVVNDNKGRWLLQPHRLAQSEVALTAIIQNKPVSLVIDRTFIDENEIRWIIDYKTSMPEEETIEAFLIREKNHYQTQMQSYYEAFRLREARQIKLALYFPSVPAWIEWGDD